MCSERKKLLYFEVKFYPKEPTMDLRYEQTRFAVMSYFSNNNSYNSYNKMVHSAARFSYTQLLVMILIGL